MNDQEIIIKLEEIAKKLGVSITQLLQSYGDPKHIVEEYQKGNIRVLNESSYYSESF